MKTYRVRTTIDCGTNDWLAVTIYWSLKKYLDEESDFDAKRDRIQMRKYIGGWIISMRTTKNFRNKVKEKYDLKVTDSVENLKFKYV